MFRLRGIMTVLAALTLTALAACTTGNAGPAPSATQPSASPSAAGDGLSYSPTATPLLDMRKVKLYDGDPVTVPNRPGGCPPATLRFTLADRSTTANGIEYSVSGQGAFGSGDLNLDGVPEDLALVSCSVGGKGRDTLVVVGAVDASHYKTIAAGVLPGGVQGLLVQGQAIIAYRSHYQFVQANEIGRYRISKGDQIIPE
jgi:hypothetical protein